MEELCKIGVGRNGKNEQQGYMYRAADDIMNAVMPVLSGHGVYMRPFFTIEEKESIPTKTGQAEQIKVKLEMSLHDADCTNENNVIVEATVYGEARDSGDKCIMKAQTAAYKNWFIMVLGIPVIGTENDPDSTSPEMENTYNKRVSKVAEKKQPEPVSIIDTMASQKAEEPPVAVPQEQNLQEAVKETKQVEAPKNVIETLPEQQQSALASLGIF